MILFLLGASLLVIVSAKDDSFQDESALPHKVDQNTANIDSLQETIAAVARQLMLQQLFVEERIRSEGHSGIKQTRVTREGTRPYYGYSHIGNSIAAIHDHANNIRTVGMGEFIAVLNGVEFRTRHNDYRLFMPHSTNPGIHKLEPIPFPDVPPEVTAKSTVEEQVVEMREWFKAWRDQDYTTRDYRKYFKPVLCYLEGAWMNGNTHGDIEEPFPSDRHFVDAKNWFDLHEKIRFTSYSGRKSNFENYAFLPTTIMNMSGGVNPVFAQWNYRIACHPLRNDLPTDRLRVVDEFAARMRGRYTMKQFEWTRQARFQLQPQDKPWTLSEYPYHHSLLDKLMYEIPGKDNYRGKLTDDAFDLPAMEIDGNSNEKINAAYYNRVFKVAARGAMGLSRRQRGFSDENLFMAMTTHKVAGMNVNDCQRVNGQNECKRFHQKWSYAVPLELIYLTPLNKWNPYNIEFKGAPNSAAAKTVTAGGRNGVSSKTAFDGVHETTYYMTPAAFYDGDASGKDPADTTMNVVWVLDKNGTPRKMSASGVRIFFPPIPGIGILRQRYPIMPVHGEGSSVWKETSANLDALMKSQKYYGLYQQAINAKPLPTQPPASKIRLLVPGATLSNDVFPGVFGHQHEIELDHYQVVDLRFKGIDLDVTTTGCDYHRFWS